MKKQPKKLKPEAPNNKQVGNPKTKTEKPKITKSVKK